MLHRLIPVIFMAAITIHNVEEAIWLPAWSVSAEKYYKPVAPKVFRFSVLMITLLAYAISTVVLIRGYEGIMYQLMFGFMGAMALNAIFPHLVMTVVLRQYAPGLVTGVLINIPCFLYLMVKAIQTGIITWKSVGVYTAIMAVTLLGLLPVLFRLARKLFGEY